MSVDKISIENIKDISHLEIAFEYPESNIIVVTGKNGLGKTSIVKSFKLITDPNIFDKSSGPNTVRENSRICFKIGGYSSFSFTFNKKINSLDCKDKLPSPCSIISELSIPFGARFQQFSLISNYDAEIRANIAASEYARADELIDFLSEVYSSNKFNELKVTRVKKNEFYFLLKDDDYYIREDHLSSGEFFLVQIFRLITSEAGLVIIDELDIALDASAQANLYNAMKSLLEKYNTRVITISHSLAFMGTIDDGGLYYLEKQDGSSSLERRSFGYIKSDLYGFRGKERYIITEDKVLVGFLNFLISENIKTFFEYEIVPVGGQPQIDTLASKIDSDRIFGEPDRLAVFIDKDIKDQIKYAGESKVLVSPVDDIELFVWQNKERLLPDVTVNEFKPAINDKKTAKTYWKKLINSGQKKEKELYCLVAENNDKETKRLIDQLEKFLCLKTQCNKEKTFNNLQ